MLFFLQVIPTVLHALRSQHNGGQAGERERVGVRMWVSAELYVRSAVAEAPHTDRRLMAADTPLIAT